jgi:DNA invertase Pin-like site-specific DNA recombinase
MTKVVLYARVSTKDKQETENQLLQLREFCAKQGWQIQQEYIDRVSGGKSNREQFLKMFEAASQRRFDLVLFWALDRFTREGTLATLQYLQRLTECGVGYKSFTEQYLDSCGIFRDAVISLLATLARQEKLRLSERVQAGLQRARKEGRVGGRPRADFARKKVLTMREAGHSLRDIATTLGTSLGSVQRELSAQQN